MTKPVLLRHLDSGKSKPFEPAHAERLLAYPGSRFVKVEEPENDVAVPFVQRVGKKKAAAKTAPVAPSPDATPTE